MMLVAFALLLPILALGGAWRWPRYRWQMFWGAILSLPFVGLEVFFAGSLRGLGISSTDAVVTLGALIGTSLGFGALAALGYEAAINERLTPTVHLDRRHLWYLSLGPVVWLGLVLSRMPSVLAGGASLLVVAVIFVSLRRPTLLWDVVVSAVGFGGWYVLLEITVGIQSAGDLHQLLAGTEPFGVTFASVPFERVLTAAGVGALLGPIFAATKHQRARGRNQSRSATIAKMGIALGAALMLFLSFGWGLNEYVLDPKLVSITPTIGSIGVATDTEIVVRFNHPVQRDQLTVTISPAVDGTWVFTDPLEANHGFRVARYHFVNSLMPATTYHGQITGIKSLWGETERTLSFSFQTRDLTDIDGIVVASRPASGPPVVPPCDPMAISFASPYDPSSQFDVTIDPPRQLRVTLDADRRGLIVRPNGCLDPAVVYRLTVDRRLVVRDTDTQEILEEDDPLTVYETLVAVGPAATGADQAARVLGVGTAVGSTSLKVVLPRKVLPIAVDYQDQPLSCEAASLKMALAGQGIKVSEGAIMKIVGYDPTPHRGRVWGDPSRAFVGNIVGRQNTTGYGVHWQPIARAAKKWRPNTTIMTNMTPKKLATEIAAGHAVVLWGTLGRAYATPWVTPAGQTVRAWKGEHARTVIGFLGPVDTPTAFILNDPVVGRVTWSVATLKKNWQPFGASGVVVK